MTCWVHCVVQMWFKNYIFSYSQFASLFGEHRLTFRDSIKKTPASAKQTEAKNCCVSFRVNKMDLSSDNFEYIFQLTKVLSSECRANRQEREKIETLLQRLAKQSGVSYEQLSDKVSSDTLQSYEKLSSLTDRERLISENYKLVYEIELQEYINRKILTLVSEIAEHLNSIRSFIIERKLTGFQNIDNYLEERFAHNEKRLSSNFKSLQQSKDNTTEKIEIVGQELRFLIDQIDWELIPKDSKAYAVFLRKITQLDTDYGLCLSNEKLIKS